MYRIAVIPGDGTGPEVIREALKVMDAACRKHNVAYETIPRWVSPVGLWLPQQEPSDSTTHSFSIADWPRGVGLWYYFDGYREGRTTVSSSILFGSVRPPPDFNPTLQLTAKPILNLALTRSDIHGIEPRATLVIT